MSNSLQKDIEALLVKYPKLKNSKLVFDEADFKILPNIGEATGGLPLCKMREESPEVLKGLSPKIEPRKSAVHGYGVFAKETIEEGEMIEQSKLLKLANRAKQSHDAVLADYVWANQACDCIECKTYGAFQYFPFGYISLYNHSDGPNTRQEMNFKNEVATITARQRIEKDEEIFVTYGNKYWIIRDFWKQVGKTDAISKFHKANIQPKIK
ncbi:SET domain-containing protein-lysine N-methyltransferase [Mucilaginibacter sp. AW1-3]